MQIILLDAVETFFGSLNEKELAKTIRTIELLEEFENKLGMPHSKHLADGLLELRVRGTREIRIFYCFNKNNIILMHAFTRVFVAMLLCTSDTTHLHEQQRL